MKKPSFFIISTLFLTFLFLFFGQDLRAANDCVFPVNQQDAGLVGGNGGDFGDSRTDLGDDRRCHAGVDFRTKGEGKIYAVTEGTVVFRNDSWSSYTCDGGKVGEVMIEHNIGGVIKSVRYAEINAGTIPATLKVGTKVEKGQFLGKATNCGMLHLEVWDQGTKQSTGWNPKDTVSNSDNACINQNLPYTPGLNNPTQFANNLKGGNCSFGTNIGGKVDELSGGEGLGYKKSSTSISKASVCVGDCPQANGDGLACWPISGTVTQNPFTGFSHGSQDAIDIGVSTGTNIYAPVSGTIRRKCDSASSNCTVAAGGGCMAILTINSGELAGKELWFMHLMANVCTDNSTLKSGQIEAGEIIGYSGNTGSSTGPHLHYELKPRIGSPSILNRYLKSSEGQKVESCYAK